LVCMERDKKRGKLVTGYGMGMGMGMGGNGWKGGREWVWGRRDVGGRGDHRAITKRKGGGTGSVAETFATLVRGINKTLRVC
jgi:hypothetical protein